MRKLGYFLLTILGMGFVDWMKSQVKAPALAKDIKPINKRMDGEDYVK